MLLVGIQGDVGSATEMAARHFCESEGLGSTEFVYLITAQAVVDALSERRISLGVLAVESPIGNPIPETATALERRTPEIVAHAELPVEHAILGRQVLPFDRYTSVVSHPIALAKHQKYLKQTFPSAQLVESKDSGSAARELAESRLSEDSLVIAMPSAADSLGLEIVLKSLPNNESYLTHFMLLKSV